MNSLRPLWRPHLTGLVFWLVAFVVVMILFARNPDARSVTLSYRFGSQNFLAGLPIYDLKFMGGYLYAPAFAVFFAPFHLLGPLAGDGLWRVLCFAVFTYAALRQARRIDAHNAAWLLSTALFLALPLSLGAIRNAQSTILLAGACWLLILSALERKTAQTLFWATLAVIAKPIAIIVLLLVGAIRPRLIPVLLLSLAIVLALPYGFAPAAYVNDLYHTFWLLMLDMSVQSTVRFTPADFTAPLTELGIGLSDVTETAVRFVFALLTLGAVAWLDRNAKPSLAGLAIVVVAFFYMSVFNPRVESNTYALLAPPFGFAIAAMMLMRPRARLPLLLAGLLFVAGLTGISPAVSTLMHSWFRPVACSIVFLCLAVWFVPRIGAWPGRGARQADAVSPANG